MQELSVRCLDGAVEEQCPECLNWYSAIGVHWTKSGCQHPELRQDVKEVLKGMMLGDGTLSDRNVNPKIRIAMINKRFLEYLDDFFGWFSTGVSMNKTAQQQGDNDSGVVNEINPENCHDYYRLSTRSHPFMKTFRDWYDNSVLKFPCDLKPTPIALKMWYISDGNLKWDTNSKIEIASVRESQRPEAIEKMFSRAGFDVTNGDGNHTFRLPTSQTEEFFDYIGEVVPGFEYKWAYRDKDRYHSLMKETHRLHCTQTLD